MEPHSGTVIVPLASLDTLKRAACLVLLATLTLPHSLHAQPPAETSATDTAGELAALIRAEQASNGPYSAKLLELFAALILRHEEDGELALASAMIEQALLIVRANRGLYSLEQAPLLQRRIRHEEARGNFGAAWDLEQKLLGLVERNPADLRGVPILREVGDRRLAVLERYLDGEFPPQLLLGCYYNPARLLAGSCVSGSKGTAIKAMLADARHQYQDAVDVLIRNEAYSSDDLIELEMAIVHASYRQGDYSAGRKSLRRISAYTVLNEEPRRRLLDLSAQLADWDLMFGLSAQAVREYTEIARNLDSGGVDADAAAALFAPSIPITLPTFLPNPLESQPNDDSRGHIDVAFEISRFGRSRKIRVLDTSTHPSATARDALQEVVARSRFRPQYELGELTDKRVVVRYYPTE